MRNETHAAVRIHGWINLLVCSQIDINIDIDIDVDVDVDVDVAKYEIAY